MNKIYTLFLMIFLLIGTLGFVVADDDSPEGLDIPEARKVGFFENAFDRLGLALTFNKEKKIEKALELAEKRLAEAEAFAEENPEAAVRAQERYDDFVARAEEILEQIESNEGDENRSIDAISKMTRIRNQFERHSEHVDAIYLRALERFENNNASDEKVERFEMFYERALNRSDNMEARAIEKVENAMKRHKVLTEKSDEELEEMLEQIEEREGLTAARAERTERAEERVQKFSEIKEIKIERAREHLENANLTEEQKQQIRERIEETSQKAEEFRNRTMERLDETRENVSSQLQERTESLKNAIEQELAGSIA